MPETLFEGQEMGFRLIRIENPDCRRTYQIAWLKDRYLSVAARTFRDYVVDYFQEQPKQYKI